MDSIVPCIACCCIWINICLFKWPRSDQLALPLLLVATICNLRLVGVEMTCVSASFGEPIKDGLSSHCRTEGESETTGADRASGTREDEGDAQWTEIPVSVLGEDDN